jgi:hypothetical protein
MRNATLTPRCGTTPKKEKKKKKKKKKGEGL